MSPPDPAADPSAVPHDIRATYASLDGARQAVQALERKGIDAVQISLEGPGADMTRLPVTNAEQRADDQALMGRVGGRALVGLVVGAIVGAALCAVVAVVADITMAVVIAGVIVGGIIGFLWRGYSGLAVSEAWTDTYAGPDDGEGLSTTVVVHADGDATNLVDVLRRTNPVTIGLS